MVCKARCANTVAAMCSMRCARFALRRRQAHSSLRCPKPSTISTPISSSLANTHRPNAAHAALVVGDHNPDVIFGALLVPGCPASEVRRIANMATGNYRSNSDARAKADSASISKSSLSIASVLTQGFASGTAGGHGRPDGEHGARSHSPRLAMISSGVSHSSVFMLALSCPERLTLPPGIRLE